MNIDFGINERINQELAGRRYLNSPRPEFFAIINEIIRKFDPWISLDELKAQSLGAPNSLAVDWTTFSGPALYALIDSVIFYGPHRPTIVRLGQTCNLERRIREYQRIMEQEGEILFDGVRAFFIEDEQARKDIERYLIAYFSDPENGHAASLTNINGRSFPPFVD